MRKDEKELVQMKRTNESWEVVFGQLSPGFAMDDPEFRRLRKEFETVVKSLDAYTAPAEGWKAYRSRQEPQPYDLYPDTLDDEDEPDWLTPV